jgi:large subunit ribosomal protein L9
MKELNFKKASETRKLQQIEAEARELANKLEEITVKISTKAGEAGRLFGSITNKDITDNLAKQHKITLDKKKIELKEHIKALGVYSVNVKLHPNVQTTFKVQVTEE